MTKGKFSNLTFLSAEGLLHLTTVFMKIVAVKYFNTNRSFCRDAFTTSISHPNYLHSFIQPKLQCCASLHGSVYCKKF